MDSKTRFVLYSVVLVLAIATLSNLITELVLRSEDNAGIAITLIVLIAACIFIALFNYESPKTPQQIEAALVRKLQESWLQSLVNIKRSERLTHLGLEWIERPKTSASNDAAFKGPLSILDAFESAEGTLLIVGKRGTGKTFTLLELAGSLLLTMKKNPLQAIPIVFNLSNFKGKSLERWIVGELKTRYDVAEDIGRGWLLQGRLTLLLDGLDEADPDERCADAISRFVSQSPKPGIVVTANSDSDQAAHTGLGLAIEISLQDDNSQNFDRIAERLDKAKLLEPEFDSTKVIKWLHWLAERSLHQRQSQFTVAQIQPSWLKERSAKWLYVGSSRVAGALVVMTLGASLLFLSRGILRWVSKNPNAQIPGVFSIENHLWPWLFVTVVIGGLTIAIIDGFHIRYFSKSNTGTAFGAQHWSNIGSLASYVLGCLLTFMVAASVWVERTNAVRGAAIFAICYGVVFWFRGRERSLESDTNIADKLVWSRARIPLGFLWGIAGGIFCALVFAVVLKGDAVTIQKFQLLVLLMLLGSMVGIIAGGLRRVSIVENMSPAQGIRMSLRSTILIWLSVGAPSVLLIWGYGALIMASPEPALGGGLFYGMVLGLLCGFAYSGFGIVYRFVFRSILRLRGYAPLIDWVQFLDYAASLGFLRKVGGSYVFSQTSLRKIFADEKPENLLLTLKALSKRAVADTSS
jgi:hypothetical protein